MTEFQRVDKARHRGYRWRCGACGKTFDYASRSQDCAVNARAVGPVYCPECGAAHMIENWRNWGACKDLPIVSVPLSDLYYGPCSVCGDTTCRACSDCKIDTSVSVYVCDKGACQRAHERTHKAAQE
jgi:hypothetical protein